MSHRIEYVIPDGIGAKNGLKAGEQLLSINGEEILDEIDYQALSVENRLDIAVQNEKGAIRHVIIQKEDDEPLGLRMADTMICTPEVCKNNCIFCFVAQMPAGLRKTLYVKDDDWRMSLMMGNFITLTNVDENEFSRILRRKASPLYISVHTTNMPLREKMLKNPRAGELMEKLQTLKAHGLKYHCQIVLCPGVNDGAELEKTLGDLYLLFPAVLSIALVPVGLTKFREKLTEIAPYRQDTALQVLKTAQAWQEKCLRTIGTRLVFPADEFYCIADADLPPDEAYENYPQLENGVGMLRQFEDDFRFCAETDTRKAIPRRITLACGVSFAPFLRKWMEKYAPRELTWKVKPVVNDFFGHTVTVSGLLTGGDLAGQLRDEETDEIMISGSTVRNEGDLFLDDMSVETLRGLLPAKLTLVHGGGAELYEALLGLNEGEAYGRQ